MNLACSYCTGIDRVGSEKTPGTKTGLFTVLYLKTGGLMNNETKCTFP